MSGLPNNINDSFRNITPYCNLGDGSHQPPGNGSSHPPYSSLGDAARPNYFQSQLPQQLNGQPGNYTTLGHGNAAYGSADSHWGDSHRRGSNHSDNFGGGYEQSVNWSAEPNYTGQTSNSNQQIPVTWNVEPNQQQSNLYAKQISEGQVPITWNVESNQQSCNQSSQINQPKPTNFYAQLGQSNVDLSQYTQQMPNQTFETNTFIQKQFQNLFPPPLSGQHMPTVAIPPPPPPPPPVVQSKAKDQSFPPKQSNKQNAKKTKQQKANEKNGKKKGKRKRAEEQQHLKLHPPKKNDNSEEQQHLKWQPPKKNDKSASAKTQTDPNPQQAQAKQSQEDSKQATITESVDANVLAINALSALETKWTGPGRTKPQKLSNRQKRRRRQKKNKEIASAASDGGGNKLNEAVELIGEWIDVNSDSKPSEKVIDLTGDEQAFPPLSGQHTKSAEATATVRELSSIPIDQMSKAKLSSYAAVLLRAINENNVSAREAARKAAEPLHLASCDSTGDEMDISDDENEVTAVKPPSSLQETSDASLEPQPTKALHESYASVIPPTMPLQESSDFRKSNSNESQVSTNAEEEKKRLRLEELRAKVKLANAKLRLAKRKLALGNGDAAKPPPPPNNSPSTDGVPRIMRPANSSIPDLTVVRLLGNLVVNVSMMAEPREKVRYVPSVYQESSDCEDESEEKPKVEQPSALVEEQKPAAADAEALKQKLQLAKLRLELRKKELALKKKQSEAVSAPENSSNTGMTSTEAISKEDQPSSHVSTEANADLRRTHKQETTLAIAVDPEKNKAAQIEELRRRQKELKQSNEVSNLKNLVQRQREILRVKGKELADSSSQLQSCIDEIKSKQDQLTASEKKLEEMNHRKRIMEGMIFRATEKLMAARRNLKQTQDANVSEE